MNRKSLLFFCAISSFLITSGQTGEAPNYANSAMLPPGAAAASKMNSTLVNLFTGTPRVSIPIYSFKSNSGLSLSVSIDYSGGGVQVAEYPTPVGLSWYLNAGGIITRTVRGMPDDMPVNGYLYAPPIPADWRANGNKYYHDSVDAQQDIFQFNLPGVSGKFFMGKNGQIIVTPLSKIKVIPSFQALPFLTNLKSFRIITEDGVKYDFEDAVYTSVNIDNSFFPPGTSPTPCGYCGITHATAWYLNRIISPFDTDTIKLNYQQGAGEEYRYNFPQITFVNNANGTRKNPTNAPGYGNSGSKKIASIDFPDKTSVSFVYSNDFKYAANDYALSKIKISDTTLRFGYLLDYQTSYTYQVNGKPHRDSTKLLLKSVTPFTKYEKQDGYRFEYNLPLFPLTGGETDTIQNKIDYWGFYNGAVNGTNLIPRINGYAWGANRDPNPLLAKGNSLARFYLPTGGFILFTYEPNDHYPYTKQTNQVSISPAAPSQNLISVNQVFNSRNQLLFFLDKSVARTGTAPVSGSGNLNVFLKSSNGMITYYSLSVSLYDLFYSGMRSLNFNLPNGTYRLETSLSPGTTLAGNFPVNITWENKITDNLHQSNLSGGIRVNSVEKHNIFDAAEGIIETYKYVMEDGKSSGFMGDIPRYDYPYREIITNSGTITDYTAVSSQPVAPVDYAQGSPVGYSRVEIIKRSYNGNLGKEVQEFTDFNDLNSNAFTSSFPYAPQDMRNWGLGLPKKLSVYDSSGKLVKRTVNNYQFDTVIYNNNSFKSLKLGHSQTTYASDPNFPPVSKTKGFIGQEYYLANGRASLVYSTDTLYQDDGSVNTSWQQMVYDTNYNVTKIISPYDRTRNLLKEQRMYYPYNYAVGGGVGKLRDSSVISQMVDMETWITGDNNPRLISGVITSFRQIPNGEIKPDSIFSFESNKPVTQGTVGGFDPYRLNRNPSVFKPQSYFTSYNAKGNLTEMKNLVTGKSNSILLDYNQQYPVANVTNALQADIAYTSFETASSGNWNISSTQRDTLNFLTGKKSYNLSAGIISKNGLDISKSYLLTIWTKSGSIVFVNGNLLLNPIAAQNYWSLFSITLNNISTVIINGNGVIDEVRLHPKDANMTTRAYEPMVGVISSADANNTVMYNEYDNLNRLKIVRDKDRNILQRLDYSDTTMSINTLPVWQGVERRCSPNIAAGVDSVYRDINVFSDSSGYIKIVYQGIFDCNCPSAINNPQFKVVNGSCEMGSWGVVSSVYKKVIVDGYYQWRWVCTYRYCFSDGSQSTYYQEGYFTTPCAISCGIIIIGF